MESCGCKDNTALFTVNRPRKSVIDFALWLIDCGWTVAKLLLLLLLLVLVLLHRYCGRVWNL